MQAPASAKVHFGVHPRCPTNPGSRLQLASSYTVQAVQSSVYHLLLGPAGMSFDTVLRIKRKRTDDPLKMLLTSEDAAPTGKKRRVWQLSRSSDCRGIPVPIPSRCTTGVEVTGMSLTQGQQPPRFSVRKRKASESFTPRKSQRILDLEREEAQEEIKGPVNDVRSSAENEALSSMLSEYLATNDLTQSSSSSIDEDFVYDIYYPQATSQAIEDATAALNSNYGLLEHFDWEKIDNLVVDEEDQNSEGEESEDSNAEDWAGNDYPDEEEDRESENSFDLRGSGSDASESFDKNDWD